MDALLVTDELGDPLLEGAAGPAAGGASAGEENGELLQVTLLETKVDFLCPSSLGNKAFCVRLESRMLKAVLDFIAPDCQAALVASRHSSCSKAGWQQWQKAAGVTYSSEGFLVFRTSKCAGANKTVDA